MREKIASAYFTSPEECDRLLSVVDQVWGLDGLRALEPAVGSGNIIRASSPYSVEWVTNELHPDHTNFIADHNKSIFELTREDVGPVDIVIGNPPFTGKIAHGGRSLNIALAFIDKAFEFADRVAFILPANVLRARQLYSLPPFARIVAHTPPKHYPYSVAEIAHGDEKMVRTSIVLFERADGDNRPPYDESPVAGLEWLDSYEEATHAVGMWGGLNLRSLDGCYGREEPYAGERPARITDPRIEGCLLSRELTDYLVDTTCASLFCPDPEINHLVREMLEAMGE